MTIIYRTDRILLYADAIGDMTRLRDILINYKNGYNLLINSRDSLCIFYNDIPEFIKFLKEFHPSIYKQLDKFRIAVILAQ